MFLSCTGGDFKERVVPPLVLPKIPSRVYVRFGEAVSLEGLDRSDRTACQETYENVKVWYESADIALNSILTSVVYWYRQSTDIAIINSSLLVLLLIC